jgi:hypothetical protein
MAYGTMSLICGNTNKNTWCHNTEQYNSNLHCYENLTSHPGLSTISASEKTQLSSPKTQQMHNYYTIYRYHQDMQPYLKRLCCGEHFIKEATNDKQFPPLCSDIYSIQPWTTDLELQ